jgi:membrane-bound lytic murein transglycosylase A
MNTSQPPRFTSSALLRWAATAALASLAGCAVPPPASTASDTGSADTSASRPPPTGASVAGQARTFSTQLATYTSVGFDAVPGWSRDDFSESWPAFLGSCKVLTGRGAEWKEVCDRALKIDGKSNTAIRGFFESGFSAYQIRDDDRKPDGVVTGYFEPEIAGARQYAAPFIYPVYGQPDDMLFADARKLPAGNGTVAARVEGRNVVVQAGLSTRDMGAPGLYALDLAGVSRDTLDRKVRLRVEGKQLLPYYTREEIETKGAPNAKVLAFVSSATALYEMQIQGSGRIKLASGDSHPRGLRRAERPALPSRRIAQAANGKPRSAVKVRGSSIELQLDDGDDDDDTGAVAAGSVIRTRGFTLARPTASGAVVVPGRRTAGAVAGSGIKDPSYVFFKEADLARGRAGGCLRRAAVGGALHRGRPAQHAAGLPGVRLDPHARQRRADAAPDHRAGHRRRHPRRGARRLLLRQRPGRPRPTRAA